METKKLPINVNVNKNVDEVELDEQSTLVMDAYTNDSSATVRRPGLESLYSTGVASITPLTHVNGLYWFEAGNFGISVHSGNIYKFSGLPNSITTVNLSQTVGPPYLVLDPVRRVSFATDGTRVYMANGGQIAYTDGTTLSYLTDTDAPTTVTQIAYIDGYIMAIDGGARFYFSDVNNGLSWTATDFASTAGFPDPIVAFTIYNRNIYFFGSSSLETWQNDGQTPFSRIDGGAIEVGCSAAGSVTITDDGIYFLDNKRAFRKLVNGQAERISTPYEKVVQEFEIVSDCVGDRIDIGGKKFIVFSFPSANRTLVYNYGNDTWSEWGKWESQKIGYDRWLGNSYTYATQWNTHLVGSRSSMDVYRLGFDLKNDAGDLIRSSRITGHINHGTTATKRNKELRFIIKRGSGGGATPTLMIRWQDNNRAVWSNEHKLNLGQTGEYDLVGRLHRTGIYRSRRYEFSCTDEVDLVLRDVEEDYEVLR